MIVLNDYELEFSIKGQVVRMQTPTVKQLKEFRKKLKADSEESLEEIVILFKTLGMPEDVADSLNMRHIKIIMESLSGEDAKKN